MNIAVCDVAFFENCIVSFDISIQCCELAGAAPKAWWYKTELSGTETGIWRTLVADRWSYNITL
jgi:hypothetical protein